MLVTRLENRRGGRKEKKDLTCPLNGDVVLDDVGGVLLSSSDHLNSRGGQKHDMRIGR
jgi:hypothetical protein